MVILEELLHCVDLYNCLCECLVIQLCPTLWDPIDYDLPGSSVHGILQARILERVAISTSRESSWPRDWTCVSCIAGRFFTHWIIREALTIVSVQFSSSVVSDSLQLHELQHTRPPCPSPTPGVHPNPCPLSSIYFKVNTLITVPFTLEHVGNDQELTQERSS